MCTSSRGTERTACAAFFGLGVGTTAKSTCERRPRPCGPRSIGCAHAPDAVDPRGEPQRGSAPASNVAGPVPEPVREQRESIDGAERRRLQPARDQGDTDIQGRAGEPTDQRPWRRRSRIALVKLAGASPVASDRAQEPGQALMMTVADERAATELDRPTRATEPSAEVEVTARADPLGKSAHMLE